ncbi:MAG: 2-oxoacid:acceptor oxidoreductase subunit alpha [Prolixibacteraceae bacterium]|jgi:2-oxoglutarate ferredoxin oxidoreductase subunit alpha|nr:2-oxoacid:acceptor oxidoreductase subunit alpha [Prolixibacteraceae bacterium]MDI9563583.1 2-oxoacid:acceptor oxidoreductase subunit alpha [Bacteroidota bacterium]OQB78978.1 MAG: 2-oxoglutarate oxidoreductase subunit KorA [Bacteroidetes bacterium ADurb.Bin123]HNU78324.1 2-oxoacid:acceptor oxidoreductase subunit alpha [Prolixibacteraceae bacterium]HNZ69765.1 2-oxoacid:acceptor oxidoreductase subunit alpha [Prolixibacteraceae bacterium]
MKEAKVIEMDEVAIRFSGDSGDGMQLTGTLFSDASALLGNDISTFPDYPAEIRAPQGTVGGVSGFQVQFGQKEVNTPGDYAHVLVAMNPAAVKANAKFMKPGGTIIYDKDAFNEKNFRKANFTTDDPFTELNLIDYVKIGVPITELTQESLKDLGLDNKSILRSKNMFALGLVCWMFNRPLDYIEEFITSKFSSKPTVVQANMRVLHAGYNYGMNLQHMTPRYMINPAPIEPGLYRNINGNQATAWGLLAASEKSGRPLFIGSYPITPATEILQTLAERKDLGVKSFQAEDEIAGITTALGASFAGHLAVTSTSGPGFALKSEAIGLGVMAELPLVVVNVQRGGPSTGLPTKTEQSDLLQALYGRNGESPVAVIAASTPSDCFWYAFTAARIAMERMVPVVLLTDGFLGNGSEPWKIPSMADLPDIHPRIAKNPGNYKPYERDGNTLSRSWAFPGSEGFAHRIGGLEKNITGNVSHDPDNHQKNCEIREAKVQRIVDMIPDLDVYGDPEGDVLLVGWGGTFGHMISTVRELRRKGKNVSLAHFNYIKPLPANTGEVFRRFKKILVCEINLGQFVAYLRDKLPGFTYYQYNKVKGLPFTVQELEDAVTKLLEA